MGWNEPEKGKNAWNGKKQPPDLDEAFIRLQNQLKKLLFGSKQTNSPQKGNNQDTPSSPGGFMLGLIGLFVLILWGLSGIFIVGPAEQAVILRFGKYQETVGPGPHWIPRFISSKIVKNVDRVMDYSYSAQMLTKDQSLVSVALVVQYRIDDLGDYLFNVTEPEKSLQQAVSSALRQVVGTTTFDQILTEGRDALGTNIEETLRKILSKYKPGIVIISVAPQPRAPQPVQDAFDDAIKAREDDKRFREQAYAYEAKVIPIAEGRAKRLLEEAKGYEQKLILNAAGDVAEFLSILPQYELSPRVLTERMYIDAMQQVFDKTTKIIVDTKNGNVLYLPLEQLMNPRSNQALSFSKKNMTNPILQTEKDLESQVNRTAVRKTYEQERGTR